MHFDRKALQYLSLNYKHVVHNLKTVKIPKVLKKKGKK